MGVLLSLSFFMMSAQKRQSEWGDGQKRLDWWIGGSLGVTHSLGENAQGDDFTKNIPGVDFQLGTYFTQVFGLRLSTGLNPQFGTPGQAQREGDPETYQPYRFYALTGYVDAILDLTRLFQPRKKYRPTFSVLMYAGGGGLEAFHYDLKVMDWEYYPVDYYDKTCWAAHAGLMTSYRLSPHWDMTLEGSYNITEDRYDGVKSGKMPFSGYLKLHAGMAYHFYERSSGKIRLTTDEEIGWQPSYTRKDREKVLKEQHKKFERARKETAKRRAERDKELQKRNKEAQKANERIRKAKAQRAKLMEEELLYNER